MTEVRLALYCHNVTGLGHIARTAAVAAAACGPGRSVTLVTGCRHLGAMRIAPEVRVIELPPAVMHGITFEAADPALAGTNIIKYRAERLVEILRDIAPHAMLVDNSPYGLAGELVPALTAARAERWPTRFIWGIPYLEGGPVGTPRARNPRVAAAVEMYSSAIGYCDPADWDALRVYDDWALPARRAFMGLVAAAPEPPLPTVPGLVTVACGGGTSAPALVDQVIAARRMMRDPAAVRFRIVTGPMAAPIAERYADEPRIEWLAAAPAETVIRDAAAVVARTGYNTAALLLRSDRPVVFVPSPGASGDQLSRAARAAAAPGVWSLPANTTPPALAAALDAALACGAVSRSASWPCDGARLSAEWLLAEGRAAAEPAA